MELVLVRHALPVRIEGADGPADPPLADLGPPPGPVTTSWQLSTPVADSDLPAYDRVAYTVVDGELVIISGHGLTVRDARTGRERWHYYRAQWSLLGWARTGQVLVAYLERTGHRGNRLMVGLDAVSGTLLWRHRFVAEGTGTRVIESYEVTKPITAVGWFIIDTLYGMKDRTSDLRRSMVDSLDRLAALVEEPAAAPTERTSP